MPYGAIQMAYCEVLDHLIHLAGARVDGAERHKSSCLDGAGLVFLGRGVAVPDLLRGGLRLRLADCGRADLAVDLDDRG